MFNQRSQILTHEWLTEVSAKGVDKVCSVSLGSPQLLPLAFISAGYPYFFSSYCCYPKICCFFKPIGPWISTWILFAIPDVYLGPAFRLRVVWIGSSVVLLLSIKPSLRFLFFGVTSKCLQIAVFYSQHSIFMGLPFHIHKFN